MGDIVHNVVVRLAEKDAMWDHTRGRYSTFVEAVMVSVLANCHETARPVSGPTNSYSRMKRYRQRQSEGTITQSMVSTMNAIECVMGEFESWNDAITLDDPVEGDPNVGRLMAAVQSIEDPVAIWAYVHKNGLFGRPRMTNKQIGARLGVTSEHVKDILKEAQEVVKKAILGA